MYHALWRGEDDPDALARQWAADSQLRDPGARLYALDRRVFERQMRQIAALRPACPESWDRLDASTPNAAWITFDDGHRSNHDLALPILQSFGLRAMFFVTTDWIGSDGFMTEDQLRALRRAGMLLGTHGCSHAYFSGLSPEALRRELTASKERLEGVLGEPVTALALPGGRNRHRIQDLARQAGYRHLFTSRIALAKPGQDPLDWPRIPIANRQPEDYLPRLLAGDARLVAAQARAQRRRDLAKRVLGNAAYDFLRGLLLAKR
jgi:peptidoglycan/xylan/chitin deacetylase (PgdA/CDA1 family)